VQVSLFLLLGGKLALGYFTFLSDLTPGDESINTFWKEGWMGSTVIPVNFNLELNPGHVGGLAKYGTAKIVLLVCMNVLTG
jgi:hypothetical protein